MRNRIYAYISQRANSFAVRVLCVCVALILYPLPSIAATNSLHMEDMTWMDVRDHIRSGYTTVIVPVGSVEQSGPQLVVAKHNMVVRFTAHEIAKRLGKTLVAPVVPFAPAGRIDPPEGHMQFPGTISLSAETFSMLLADVVGSLRQNGFRTIAIIGDHGGSQEPQKTVAQRLNAQWQGTGVTVIHVSHYYDQDNGQEKWAQSIGVKVPNPAAHGGFFDTSELMAVNAGAVYTDKFGIREEKDYKTTGAMGDSTKATVNYGRRLLSMKADAAVAQIRDAVGSTR